MTAGRRATRGETGASEPAAASCGERGAPVHKHRTSTLLALFLVHYIMFDTPANTLQWVVYSREAMLHIFPAKNNSNVNAAFNIIPYKYNSFGVNLS